MTPRTGPRRNRRDERGQIIVVFALALIAVVAMAGLLLDGGQAWANRRQAQAAADTGALAAAKAIAGGSVSGAAEAAAIAGMNGFGAGVDCAGNALPDNGVTVHRPPTSGAFAGDNGYVEVLTNRAMKTTFAQVVGQACWMVSARAVASVISQVAPCTFCALSDWTGRNTLILDNGNDLRVDGGIMVNQDTWYSGTTADNRCGPPDPPGHLCSPSTCDDWTGMPSNHIVMMCGDGLYVDHSGGATNTVLSAETIAVTGGWQARSNGDVVHADKLATPCPAHPRYLSYATPETNVCIGVPQINDPLDDPTGPAGNRIPAPDPDDLSTCPAGPNPCGPVASASCAALPGTTLRLPTGTFSSRAILNLSTGTGPYTICPGLYYGGFVSHGTSSQPKIFMLPGIYYMVGGGFTVSGASSIDGSSGVMIYNSGGAFSANTVSDPSLIPAACPPPVGSLCHTAASSILTTSNPTPVNADVVYELNVVKNATDPRPTGTAASFNFYDGQTLIACRGGGVAVATPNASTLRARCTARYTEFGTRGITAVYLGDSIYAPSGNTAIQTIEPPDAGGVVLNTGGFSSCVVAPCGKIVLHAPTSGRYNGLLIFQDRANGGGTGIRIDPLLGAPACTGSWMTAGVPPDVPANIPAPCGPLGGLSGTIYAIHQSTGSDDWDAVVNIEASGVANLQVIAAQIRVATLGTQARLTHIDPGLANGKIQLVE